MVSASRATTKEERIGVSGSSAAAYAAMHKDSNTITNHASVRQIEFTPHPLAWSLQAVGYGARGRGCSEQPSSC